MERLEARGVLFCVKGNVLEIDAPAEALLESDRIQLRERRWDLAAWLRGDHTTGTRRLSKGRVMWLLTRRRRSRLPTTAIMDD